MKKLIILDLGDLAEILKKEFEDVPIKEVTNMEIKANLKNLEKSFRIMLEYKEKTKSR